MGIKVKSGSKVHAVSADSKQQLPAVSTASVVKRADELCVAREKFETETLARSNDELYGILSEVYGLFKQAFAGECLKETVVAMKAALKERGVRVQANTPALTVFVRYVFNSDRKRAYNYASTLMAAAQAEVEPAQLADFIKGKNGVEECKKEFRKKEATVLKEAAIKAASSKVLQQLKAMKAEHVVKLAGPKVQLAEGASFAFVLARIGSTGTLELLQAVSTTTVGMQNAAIKELAKDYIAKQEHAAEAAKKKADVAATEKAAASMTVRELEMA